MNAIARAVIATLISASAAGAQVRVREIATVPLKGGGYAVQARSDGNLILMATNVAFKDECTFELPRHAEQWVAVQRHVVDTAVAVPQGELLEVPGRRTEHCKASVYRTATPRGSSFQLSFPASVSAASISLDLTKSQVDALLSSLEKGASAVREMSPLSRGLEDSTIYDSTQVATKAKPSVDLGSAIAQLSINRLPPDTLYVELVVNQRGYPEDTYGRTMTVSDERFEDVARRIVTRLRFVPAMSKLGYPVRQRVYLVLPFPR